VRSSDVKVDILGRVPLFSGLSKQELRQLGRMMDEIDVPAGKVLTREGASGGEFFIVLEGSVSVEQNGKRVRDLGPGDFLGEIALVLRRPRTATTIARSPCRLLVLATREFRRLLETQPRVETKIMRALAERVAAHEPEAAI
jgi:CRP-like cAMP-binding protein